ncbi:hairy/enhancer-of-split related with YRPW motif protein-like protein [Dinothrombium tinctorium]|uniref:Hairy/enhancer-of-split related with YRPW motif protein-like protein n=1 Tax=Dinothrombium tinctorium TaxID=1965070 RepID=A0A3S3P0S6_9ACAR|nr:hairy/enhancer-of-split related with YRPW motif protein-like protein [Dinothrombium tinctorium]RWS09307.1 hairy/enhancer-of-split related with YRPW motif protein-like protein [Dinothrombium tinctorium]RWS09885.1 hairy/enhancer-of-split related with YRPW motif protein-like protein [Dinothrombium tinctorium]
MTIESFQFIEKKRRDRINNSLQELKRLVPAAFEKQGAHKLEKAEILQLTVDHLRNLQAKGFDAFTFDPQKYALDYHSLGFRECASEVARYLVAVEGVDLQDPLRLRLMSHLQCYATQRELALKSASAHSPWNPSVFTAPPQFSSSHITSQSHNTSSASVSTSDVSNHYNNSHLSASLSDCSSILSTSTHMMPPPPPPPHVLLPKQTNSPPPSASYTSSAQQQVSNHQAHHSHQYFSPAYGTPGTHQANANGVKYCRPWGGELAY